MKAFWEWVFKTFTSDYQKEIEAHLSEATDIRDLEHRMKRLMHRGMLI